MHSIAGKEPAEKNCNLDAEYHVPEDYHHI